MKKMILVTAMVTLFSGNVPAQDTELLSQAYYSMISGTITKAMELLNAAEGELTERERELKQGLTRRFLTKTEEHPAADDLLGELLSIHRSYWVKVLTGEWSVEQGKYELYNKLKNIAHTRGKVFGEFTEKRYDELGEFLVAELEKHGIHSIIGEVSPHGDIMAWKTQSR